MLTFNDTLALFPEGLKLRLENENELSGVLQLRYMNSSWGNACVYNSERVGDLAGDVCNHYGSPFVKTTDLEPAPPGRIEFVFRVDRQGDAHWLKVYDQCARNGGKVLKMSCRKGNVVQKMCVINISSKFGFRNTYVDWE